MARRGSRDTVERSLNFGVPNIEGSQSRMKANYGNS